MLQMLATFIFIVLACLQHNPLKQTPLNLCNVWYVVSSSLPGYPGPQRRMRTCALILWGMEISKPQKLCQCAA